jgi:hypothetical protein
MAEAKEAIGGRAGEEQGEIEGGLGRAPTRITAAFRQVGALRRPRRSVAVKRLRRSCAAVRPLRDETAPRGAVRARVSDARPAPDGRMFREPWRGVGHEDWRIDAERR